MSFSLLAVLAILLLAGVAGVLFFWRPDK